MRYRKLYNLGGTIGTGAGAVAGAFLGNPVVGAKVGGALGGLTQNLIEGPGGRQVRAPVNYASSSYGFAKGGILYRYGGMVGPGDGPGDGAKSKDVKGKSLPIRTTGGRSLPIRTTNGKSLPIRTTGSRAREFKGPSHEQGGINIGGGNEVEGGETMDFVMTKGGVKKGKKPYIFSNRVKVPGKNMNFAVYHKMMKERGADDQEILDLAMQQERVTGRLNRTSDSKVKKYAHGGAVNGPPFQTHAPGYTLPSSMNMLTSGLSARSGFLPRDLNRPTDYNLPETEVSVPSMLARRPLGGEDQEPVAAPETSTSSAAPAISSPEPVGNPGTASINPASISNPGEGSLNPVSLSSPSSAPSLSSMKVGNQGGGEVAGNQAGPGWESLALQAAPDLINFAAGAFGRDKTPPATQVDRSALNNFSTRYNINPLLQANRGSYMAILNDPNATTTQKLAAQAQKQSADSQAYATKQNQETQLKARKARLGSRLGLAQSQYDSQARTDRMRSRANLGLTGNIARQALASIGNKASGFMAERSAARQDQNHLDMIRTLILRNPGLINRYSNVG